MFHKNNIFTVKEAHTPLSLSLSLHNGSTPFSPHKKFLFLTLFFFFSHLNFTPTQKLNRNLKTLQREIVYDWKKDVQQE